MPRVLTLERCPGCGGEQFAAEHVGGEVTLRRCTRCATISAPEYASPDEVYVDGYLRGESGFGLDLRHPRFQAYLAGVARRRVALVERVSGRPGYLLDVGCGTGEVLAAARHAGWRVQGVEPVADAARHAREQRGLDVSAATLPGSGLPERSFDVVSAFHVLEHMPDSLDFLSMLARWARPGGHVVVEVPNYDSAIRRHHGERWSSLRPLEHLVHFTPETLRGAFERAGLRPVRIRTASWVGPPQTLDFALADLAKFRWRPLLAPLSPRREVDGVRVRVPGRAGWWALRALERISVARGHGQVVLGGARVP
jgi:SAM-dependent methyltransferase